MNIGIDIRELEEGKKTGIGRYLSQFIDYSAAHDATNSYVLIGNHKTRCKAKARNQRFVQVRERNTLIWDQWVLPRVLRENRIDVFLTPYFKAPLKQPCRLVLIINDLIPLILPQYQTRDYFFKRLYFKWGTLMSSRRADRIITISEHTKSDLIGMFSVPADKVKVIHLAVDAEYQPEGRDDDKVLTRCGLKKPFVLYVGNLKPHKNIPLLLDAYGDLTDELRNEYQLVIASGKDSAPGKMMEQIRQRGLTPHVVLTGPVAEFDLPALYRCASLFVMPSLYEGFGLPVLEAMACGCPVVTSNGTSLPEITGEAAILVDPGHQEDLTDAMAKVLTDNETRQELIRKGLKRSALFSIQAMSEKFYDVLIHCE